MEEDFTTMSALTKHSRKPVVSATPEDVMTLEEAATFLRVHRITIVRNADSLHIPYKRLGSLWGFSRIELEAWMREQDSAAAWIKRHKKGVGLISHAFCVFGDSSPINFPIDASLRHSLTAPKRPRRGG